MRKKVSIVGAGNVGATAAHWIAAKELADVVLIDVVEGVPQGKALDLLEAMPIEKRDVTRGGLERLRRHGELRHCRHHGGHSAQAGHEPRRSAAAPTTRSCPTWWRKWWRSRRTAILIIVSNPLDAMAQTAYRQAGFNRERVIGMAGVLDSARFRTFIAEELNVSVENVTAFVLGGHGDTMVPAGALLHRRRHSHHRTDRTGPPRGARAAHARRRRRDREASQDRQRLLRAFRRGD